ncbi:brain acid soluble protein 1 [Pseudorasbora parva]|uniref:brain acid soluble protein 1 n=1 Tax=Pseudorasbora parva TaxID=51549 RepID=UPI00351F3CBA
MSYLWILVLGSLVVTGVKMQEDGGDVAENGESPADDLASTVPDEENAATEDLPPDSNDETLSEAGAEPGDADPSPKEAVDEAAAPAEPGDDETNPEPDAAEEDAPATDDAATPAAEEEPVEEAKAPAEAADEGGAAETEADPSADETEVTEEEIPAVGPAGEDEEPAKDKPAEGEAEAEAGVTEAGVTEAGVTEAGVTEAGVTDAGVTEAGVTEPSAVEEEPVDIDEAVKAHEDRFDLSVALGGDTDEEAQPFEDPEVDAGKHSAGQGKARSAGAASGPNDSGSGTVVGVVCGIAVAAVGAITGYFTYQKKKLCFKVQRADPESAKEENGMQSDPQVLSTLLNSP